MIMCAFLEMNRLPSSVTPRRTSASISSISEPGSTTTPQPITQRHPGCRMPEGIVCRTYFSRPTTTVWPALLPPAKRATTFTCGASMSTTLNVVARFAGGNNAGHTVVVGREKYVLHTIPSGILHPGCRCVIGCGVVVDPGSLIEEMEALVRRGVQFDGNLFISKNAHLIMPYHPALDLASEAKLGKRRIGTTGRGVGPAYVDKAARIGIRMADLLNERLFREKLELNVALKNRLLREIYDAETFSVEEILDKYLRYAGWLAPYITDTALLLSRWIESGYSVLFEGAQATMLDIDHGTYPYITSSSTTAGGAATGTGVPPTKIHGVVGVSKAYTTRVGAGPFPTEMTETIRARGHEYGATTGRPRRCGWFDAVVGRYATRINGLDTVALTKLDVLD